MALQNNESVIDGAASVGTPFDTHEQLLATILKNSSDAVMVHDFDGNITVWNRGAERLYGYTAAEALQLKAEDIIPADSRAQMRAIWERLRQGEQIDSWESRRVAKDGRILDVWVSVTALIDEAGLPVAIAKIERDLSERKLIEKKLRENQAQLLLFIESAPAGIAMFDRGMRYLVASRRWMSDFQLTGNLVGRSHYEVFPDIPDRWKEVHRRVLAGETIKSDGDRFARADGTVHWLKWEVLPWHTDNGDIGGIIIACEDIFARKQAEDELQRLNASLEQQVAERTAALREREERLGAILNAAADAIFTIDRQGLIQTVNPATERMFGYSASEMIGKTISIFTSGSDVENRNGDFFRSLLTGPIHDVRGELQVMHKDGSKAIVDLTVSRHQQLFIGILRDITRRKQLERDVVEIAMLEHQRIGQDLHDDCGQELTALGLLAGSLAENLEKKSPDSASRARKIEQGIRSVLRQVRSVSRGLTLAEVEPAALPAALAELTGRLSETTGVWCVFDSNDFIFPGDTNEATQFYHIAQEACTNALKHSGAKNVEVRLLWRKNAVVLRIRDDGIGIARDARDGLGQRIMRNRAATIGAKLTVLRAKPKGTVISCTLHKDKQHRTPYTNGTRES